MATLLRGGDTLRAIAKEHPSQYIRYSAGIEKFKNLACPPPARDSVSVYILYGPPGCGKTRAVYDRYGGEDGLLWRTPLGGEGKWFDGYDGHENVLIDDFDGRMSKVTLRTVLQMIDRYTYPSRPVFL